MSSPTVTASISANPARRILIVEDNEMNRDMLSRRLRRKGFEVEIAVDGRQGVDMAMAGDYDVILLDMSLPEIDGWEAARLIRASGRAAASGIIALTAHALSSDRQRALEAGCDDYDTKPVEFERLMGKISTLVARRSASADPTPAPAPALPHSQQVHDLSSFRHELRTPLNLIIGYSEMLREDASEPRHAARRASLTEILGAAQQVLAAVNSDLTPRVWSNGAVVSAALHDAIIGPLDRITAVAQELLESVDHASEQALAVDLARITGAAGRLRAYANPESYRLRALASSVPEVSHYRGASHSVEAGPAPAAPSTDGGRRARILVVDDLEDNRSVLERRLSRQGHAVVCATGGREALELVDRERFDLILLDVIMPDLDGLSVLQRLKESPATRDIPVLMISALDNEATVVRCIECGAEDHLGKPFDPVLLRARIDASLEKKRLRDTELEYLSQVNLVIAAASAVESGTYDVDSIGDVAQRGDELGRLARVFSRMVLQVQVREGRLQRQLLALRREMAQVDRGTASATPVQAVNALRPGTLFAGRYEIMDETGRGGMGIVYRAIDRELGEPVAVKTLHPELVANATALERFRSEIRLARHISDRNVVRIHDIGESSGVYYLTMEFVEGVTVRKLLDASGRLSVPATLAIATQLAHSLIVAHEKEVIHRDIKPENLLLDREGVLHVMDFGVARLVEDRSEITGVGDIVGTPAYMSPEQLLAERVDPRTDLYALGVVLYECLTGRRPFDASSPFLLVARVFKEDPVPPLTLNPAIPTALNAMILKLLAKTPDDRPASAAETARLLAEL
ncbi:MAG: response regulator [Gemmatimonadota bacterium]